MSALSEDCLNGAHNLQLLSLALVIYIKHTIFTHLLHVLCFFLWMNIFVIVWIYHNLLIYQLMGIFIVVVVVSKKKCL